MAFLLVPDIGCFHVGRQLIVKRPYVGYKLQKRARVDGVSYGRLPAYRAALESTY
jgi:hypothetical protein